MTRFTAIGHVTNDLLPGGVVPGGSALYAALTAAELGARARVVTSHGPDFVGGELLRAAGVEVEARAAAQTTCFENVYTGGVRTQRVLAIAAPLDEPVPPPVDVIFACPVIAEVGRGALAAPPGAILAAGLQGWLRAVSAGGSVTRRDLDPAMFAPCHVVFASSEDLGDAADDLIPRLCAVAQIVIVTEAERGARVYLEGRRHRVRAHPAREVDPTGAGDVFAAAFLVALAKREPPLAAGVVAACAASIAVEGEGPGALAALPRLGERIDWYRSHVAMPAAESP
jgi:sugar/nucleoside kinase (ribokinase family)